MASASQAPLVEAAGLGRSYHLGAAVVPAVRDVSLTVRAGEFVALQGPSGSGSVRIDGRDGAALSENERSDLRRDRFGFIFQTFNLIPVLTAEENVAYPLVLAGAEPTARRARTAELLSAVGLSEKARVRPDLLSGGQQQRVAIARALANRPEVVFADEPTASLDSGTAEEILDLMRQFNASWQVAFLFATHDPRVVERARRVVTLHDGAIASDRTA